MMLIVMLTLLTGLVLQILNFSFLDRAVVLSEYRIATEFGFYGHPYEAIGIPDIDVSLFWTWEGTQHTLATCSFSYKGCTFSDIIFISLISSQVFCCWWTASTPAVTRKRWRSGFSSTRQLAEFSRERNNTRHSLFPWFIPNGYEHQLTCHHRSGIDKPPTVRKLDVKHDAVFSHVRRLLQSRHEREHQQA